MTAVRDPRPREEPLTLLASDEFTRVEMSFGGKDWGAEGDEGEGVCSKLSPPADNTKYSLTELKELTIYTLLAAFDLGVMHCSE